MLSRILIMSICSFLTLRYTTVSKIITPFIVG